MNFFFILLAYGLGSIPCGLLLSKKFAHLDVRVIGSGNIGATNVLRSGHKGIAFATLLLDVLKGFLPIFIARYFDSSGEMLVICAFFSVIGHVYPVWLGFKGGKGVATAFGTLLALHPLVFIGVGLVWLGVAKLWRISSLAALSAFALSPFMALALHETSLVTYLVGVFAFLCYTHRENIKRFLENKEEKF